MKLEHYTTTSCEIDQEDGNIPLKLFIFYLEVKERERRQRDLRERDFPNTGLLPRWLQQPALDQAKARIQECDLGLPLGWEVPKHYCHRIRLSDHWQNTKSEVEQQGYDLVFMWDLGVTSGNITYYPTM